MPLLDRLTDHPGKSVYLTPAQAQRLVDAGANDQSRHALPFVVIAMLDVCDLSVTLKKWCGSRKRVTSILRAVAKGVSS